MQIPQVSGEVEFVKIISSEVTLSNIEKSFLLLYLASYFYDEDSVEVSTRSLVSCAKRYAKLTSIVAGTLITGIVDSFDKAVEYATNELNKMGPEYDC